MRSKLTYSNVVATLALFIALGSGGAYAASKLIDGKTIKPGTIKGKQLAKNAVDAKKIKNGSLTSADFKQGAVPAGARGATGPGGPAGPAGAAGGKGDRGLSAWDTIPANQTITGSWMYDDTTGTANVDDNFLVPFGAKAPAGLAGENVNFAADGTAVTDDDDAACTGTVAAPTAPAGKVCLYLRTSGNITRAGGFAVAGPTPNGFGINVLGTADNADIFGEGTWAYTAP